MPNKKTKKPFILLSNDDGIHAEGLQILAREIAKIGDVVIVAPDRPRSAASHALTLHKPLRIHSVGKNQYAVNGTPADCVTLAGHSILPRKPDLVISGVNRGANLGDDVHYSGTVAAAMEGALMGVPGIAVSLVVWEATKKVHFGTAAKFARRFAKKMLSVLKDLPSNLVFNINVPNLPESQIKGYDFVKLGKRNYGDIIFEHKDPRGKPYIWIGGDDRTFHNIEGSDGNTISKKSISITPLQSDMTHYAMLEKVRVWKGKI